MKIIIKIDTGSDLYFWIGNKISNEFVQQVFGVERLDQINPHMVIYLSLSFFLFSLSNNDDLILLSFLLFGWWI